MHENNAPMPYLNAESMAKLYAGQIAVTNPTLRENIDGRIQHYKDEIIRLEKIKEQLPQLLDVNLRDLREAMNF